MHSVTAQYGEREEQRLVKRRGGESRFLKLSLWRCVCPRNCRLQATSNLVLTVGHLPIRVKATGVNGVYSRSGCCCWHLAPTPAPTPAWPSCAGGHCPPRDPHRGILSERRAVGPGAVGTEKTISALSAPETLALKQTMKGGPGRRKLRGTGSRFQTGHMGSL